MKPASRILLRRRRASGLGNRRVRATDIRQSVMRALIQRRPRVSRARHRLARQLMSRQACPFIARTCDRLLAVDQDGSRNGLHAADVPAAGRQSPALRVLRSSLHELPIGMTFDGPIAQLKTLDSDSLTRLGLRRTASTCIGRDVTAPVLLIDPPISVRLRLGDRLTARRHILRSIVEACPPTMHRRRTLDRHRNRSDLSPGLKSPSVPCKPRRPSGRTPRSRGGRCGRGRG